MQLVNQSDIPESASELIQFIKRDMNFLDDENPKHRKLGLLRLYEIFIVNPKKPETKSIQKVLLEYQKKIFKRFFDSSEKCRELAIRLTKSLFSECDDISLSLQFLIPVLMERTGAEDLEGIAHLNEKMKPTPSEKAQVIINPPEVSEENRLLISEILIIIVSSTLPELLRPYIDDLINILRALSMDPDGKVICSGCVGIGELCKNTQDLCFHFTQILGRALLTPIVHKHSKVRIEGLKALTEVMYIGAWKYSVYVLQMLVGFRDPNIVAIKEFYESSTKLNFLAMLVKDSNCHVRDIYYRTLAEWLIKLPDKRDHEPWVVPYILAGLFDPVQSIQELVFQQIEEMGEVYEIENEGDLRERKQMGVDEEWTGDGVMIGLGLPPPFIHRPRVGSRYIIRGYVRRFLPGLYLELQDWVQENKERASHLLLCALIYTEDYITQHLDKLLMGVYKVVLEKENKVIRERIPQSLHLIGRYVTPKAFGPLLSSALKSGEGYAQTGSIKSVAYIIRGCIETIPNTGNFDKIQEVMKELLLNFDEYAIDFLDLELSGIIANSFDIILRAIHNKFSEIGDSSIISNYEQHYFNILFKTYAVASAYPKTIQKDKIQQILGTITKNWGIINEILENKITSPISDISLLEYATMKPIPKPSELLLSKKKETESISTALEIPFVKRNIQLNITKLQECEEIQNWTPHSLEWKLFYALLSQPNLPLEYVTQLLDPFSIIMKLNKDLDILMHGLQALLDIAKYYSHLNIPTEENKENKEITQKNMILTLNSQILGAISLLIKDNLDLKLGVNGKCIETTFLILEQIIESREEWEYNREINLIIELCSKCISLVNSDSPLFRVYVSAIRLVQKLSRPLDLENAGEKCGGVLAIGKLFKRCVREAFDSRDEIREVTAKLIYEIICILPKQSKSTYGGMIEHFVTLLMAPNHYTSSMKERIDTLLKAEEKELELFMKDFSVQIDKLVEYMVDEGGLAHEYVLKAIQILAVNRGVFILHQHLKALIHNYLQRTEKLIPMLPFVFKEDK